MNSEKTPLVQKLILVVLTLILACLVILIARPQRTMLVSEVAPAPQPVEEAPFKTDSPEAQPLPTTQKTPRVLPQAPRPAAGITPPPVVPVPSALDHPQQVETQPPANVTLVNPVKPRPLDIALQAHVPVLKTEICGRVRLEGTPPPEVPIRMDSACARLNEGPVATRHYVVGPNGALANVLVYIKDNIPKHYHPLVTNTALLSATRCLYEPYVQGMTIEQKLTIHNLDPLLHNFHATSKNNREFNLSLPVRGHRSQISFEKPETFVRLKCDVHPWEFAYVAVVAHPFFAVTDTNGVFCLPAGLPHGHYTLAAVHVKAGETLHQIVVEEDNLAPIELALSVRR